MTTTTSSLLGPPTTVHLDDEDDDFENVDDLVDDIFLMEKGAREESRTQLKQSSLNILYRDLDVDATIHAFNRDLESLITSFNRTDIPIEGVCLDGEVEVSTPTVSPQTPTLSKASRISRRTRNTLSSPSGRENNQSRDALPSASVFTDVPMGLWDNRSPLTLPKPSPRCLDSASSSFNNRTHTRSTPPTAFPTPPPPRPVETPATTFRAKRRTAAASIYKSHSRYHTEHKDTLDDLKRTIQSQELELDKLRRENERLKQCGGNHQDVYRSHFGGHRDFIDSASAGERSSLRERQPSRVAMRNNNDGFTSYRGSQPTIEGGFSPGTRFVAKLVRQMRLDDDHIVPLSEILDKHWDTIQCDVDGVKL